MQPASDCQIQRFHVVISYSGPLTFTPALAPPTALTFPLPLTCSLSPQLLKQKLVTQFEECRKAFRLAPASAPSTTNNGLTLTLLAAPLTMTTVALSGSTGWADVAYARLLVIKDITTEPGCHRWERVSSKIHGPRREL